MGPEKKVVTRIYSSACVNCFDAINHPEMTLCIQNDVSWIPNKKSRAHQGRHYRTKTKFRLLEEIFSICTSISYLPFSPKDGTCTAPKIWMAQAHRGCNDVHNFHVYAYLPVV